MIKGTFRLNKVIITAIMLWFGFCSCSSQQSPKPYYLDDNIPYDSLSFEMGKDNRIYVRGRINDSDSLRFLIDTGASDVVINPLSPHCKFSIKMDKSVDNLGATGNKAIQASSNNTLYIGHQCIDSMFIAAINYVSEDWDAILGLTFIKRHIIKIDYQHKKIYLYHTYKPTKHQTAFPVSYRFGLPCIYVPIVFNDCKYKVLVEVDTGSDRIFDLNKPFVDKHGLLSAQCSFSKSQITSSDGGIGTLYNVRFERVSIGKCVLPCIPGALSTVAQGVQSSDLLDGVLGNNFLKRFNMVLHLQEREIYLEPNDNLYSPFYSFLGQ